MRRGSWKEKHLDYEIETYLPFYEDLTGGAWKEKHLDYEIETKLFYQELLHVLSAWKEKHLDYEIETKKIMRIVSDNFFTLKRKASRLRDWNKPPVKNTIRQHINLEKKSISITRLKQVKNSIIGLKALSWKEKHLDYEIETTWRYVGNRTHPARLEKKSISITRLKQPTANAWNLL